MKTKNKRETNKLQKQKPSVDRQAIKEGKTMKTINNVQKTTLKSAAAIASFILISLTVSAQDFLKEIATNTSFGEIAMAMVYNSENDGEILIGSNTYSATWLNNFIKELNESSLNLEQWMVEIPSYRKNSNQKTNDQKEKLEIESLITKESKLQRTAELFDEATEPELKLEAWMIN